jgi:hypothetical protein
MDYLQPGNKCLCLYPDKSKPPKVATVVAVKTSSTKGMEILVEVDLFPSVELNAWWFQPLQNTP